MRQRLSELALSRCDQPPARADDCARQHEAFTVRHATCKAEQFRGCPTANYFVNREECERGGGKKEDLKHVLLFFG